MKKNYFVFFVEWVKNGTFGTGGTLVSPGRTKLFLRVNLRALRVSVVSFLSQKNPPTFP